MNRRNFLKQVVTLAGVATVFPLISKAGERKSGTAAVAGGLALVDVKDAQAAALNYVHDVKDVKNKSLQTERSGVKWGAQKCQGCSFYDTTKESTIGGKKAGPCQLFPGKAVAANGWCSSWAKKA